MSFRITLTVPDHALSTVMKSLGKYSVQVVYLNGRADDVDELSTQNPKRMLLSLGPNQPRKGSVGDRLCALLEKLEQQHGAHRVTRAMMNEAMKGKPWTDSDRKNGISAALKVKHLVARGIDEDAQ